jgi:hypothetical protein
MGELVNWVWLLLALQSNLNERRQEERPRISLSPQKPSAKNPPAAFPATQVASLPPARSPQRSLLFGRTQIVAQSQQIAAGQVALPEVARLRQEALRWARI